MAFLKDSALIVHAGDIGDASVLEALRGVAPVTAVRGNNDTGNWAKDIPEFGVLQTGGVRIYVLHDLSELNLNPETSGFRVVVSGHSHRPSVKEKGRALYINPGSAGPRRFKLPIAAAELYISGPSIRVRVVELGPDLQFRDHLVVDIPC
jgi:putative phosphoesterase